MREIVITATGLDGKKVFITETQHTSSYGTGPSKIGSTNDHHKAKKFTEGAKPTDILDFLDRVFRNVKSLKIDATTVEPVRIVTTFESFYQDDPDWQNAIRNNAVDKLNPIEIEMLGVAKHAIYRKMS